MYRALNSPDIGDQNIPVADIVWDNKHCLENRQYDQLLDDLANILQISDRSMPDFRIACSYAAKQGWLIVEDDVLTLTVAGAGGGPTIGRRSTINRHARIPEMKLTSQASQRWRTPCAAPDVDPPPRLGRRR